MVTKDPPGGLLYLPQRYAKPLFIMQLEMPESTTLIQFKKESPKLKALRVLNEYFQLKEPKAFLKSNVVIRPGTFRSLYTSSHNLLTSPHQRSFSPYHVRIDFHEYKAGSFRVLLLKLWFRSMISFF